MHHQCLGDMMHAKPSMRCKSSNLVTLTTLTRSMVVARHIINDVLVRARYAYAPMINAKWPQVLLGGNLEGLQNIFSRRPYQFLSVILIKTFM